jgi:hypothetical protein
MTMPTAADTLAILDVGKSHTKLLLVESSGAMVLPEC